MLLRYFLRWPFVVVWTSGVGSGKVGAVPGGWWSEPCTAAAALIRSTKGDNNDTTHEFLDMKALTFIRYDAVTSCWLWFIQNSIRVSYNLRHCCLRRLTFLNVKVVRCLALLTLMCFQMLLCWRYLWVVARPAGPSSRFCSRFDKASSTIWKIQKVFECRVIGEH